MRTTPGVLFECTLSDHPAVAATRLAPGQRMVVNASLEEAHSTARKDRLAVALWVSTWTGTPPDVTTGSPSTGCRGPCSLPSPTTMGPAIRTLDIDEWP